MSSRFQDREELLRALSHMGAAGQAETEAEDSFPKYYLPIQEHARAFDPDVVLIVGDRGSGKSELFRAVFSSGLLPAIARHSPSVAKLALLKPGTTEWRKGFPIGADFPDPSGQRKFFAQDVDFERQEQFWFAYLARTLNEDIQKSDATALSVLFKPLGGDVEACLQAFTSCEPKPLLALDALDKRLVEEDRWIFVGYDELDTLGGYDWQVTNSMIRGLISFWASYSRRWQRLRAKLFLRDDFYRRSTEIVGADIAKLAANRAELSWSDRNLYAMLVKRIANSHERLFEICKKAKIKFTLDKDLGQVPSLTAAEDARPLVNAICQEYMGANRRKGITFRWMLDMFAMAAKKPTLGPSFN